MEQEQSFGQLLDKLPSGRMKKSRKGTSGLRKTFMVLNLSVSRLNLEQEKTYSYSVTREIILVH